MRCPSPPKRQHLATSHHQEQYERGQPVASLRGMTGGCLSEDGDALGKMGMLGFGSP